MSENELHGDEIKSKNERDEKNLLFLKNNLKVIKTNSYKPNSSTRLSYTFLGKQLKSNFRGYMAYTNEKKDKLRQQQKSQKFCEITLSQPKKRRLFNKNNYQIQIRLCQRRASSVQFLPSIRLVINVKAQQVNKVN